jgi:phage gpG-like protein
MMRKTGQWNAARRVLVGGGRRLGSAIHIAVRREAERLRKEIVLGITSQSPGGQAFKPLTRLTIAERRLKGFKGTKALMRRGDLRNSIAVVARGDEAFVGVPRSSGKMNIAKIHEFGTDPFVVPITPRMRAFLAVLYRKALGRKKASKSAGSGPGYVIIQIPARPFLRPAFDVWRVGVQRRLLEGVAVRMGWL